MKAQKKRNDGRSAHKRASTKKVYIYLSVVSFFVLILILFLIFYRMPDNIAATEKNDLTGETLENIGEEIAIPSAMEDDPQSVLDKAALHLELKDNKDVVRVVIDKAIRKSKETNYRYEWTINGQSAGSSNDSISGFKRGDKVAVRITLYDGDKLWLSRYITMEIGNTVPFVIEHKEDSFDGKIFTTQINAKDPDGDVYPMNC